MRKYFYLLLILLISYSIFFDLKVGTIPHHGLLQTKQTIATPNNLPTYEEIQVKSGDTVLGIVEQLNPHYQKPISDIIKDFSHLNNGQAASTIRIGKSYKFPIYKH
jgi:cell division protein YceG involved in septum cleavage